MTASAMSSGGRQLLFSLVRDGGRVGPDRGCDRQAIEELLNSGLAQVVHGADRTLLRATFAGRRLVYEQRSVCSG